MAVLEKKRQQLVWFVDGTNGTPKNRCQFCKHVEQIIVLRAAQVMSQPPSGMWLARDSCEKRSVGRKVVQPKLNWPDQRLHLCSSYSLG